MFSRSFVRKHVISLATTASVAATSLALAHGPTEMHPVHGTMPIQYVAERQQVSDEAPFLAENDAAMSKMMADMTVSPTGDVDRDFVAMMVPHHQGAIDMAQAVLRYGSNEQLRRLAQEIIVDAAAGDRRDAPCRRGQIAAVGSRRRRNPRPCRLRTRNRAAWRDAHAARFDVSRFRNMK